MTATMHAEIVSAENALFSGLATMIVVSGSQGNLGIVPGHTPLLTTLKPGQIRIIKENDEEEILYVEGGMLEVQPTVVTILADTAFRAVDLDEAKAVQAKEEAEKMLSEHKNDIDHSKATSELVRAMAQIRAIQMLKNKRK